MKKSLIALAVLGACAGIASAQTSVTIYGSFDAGVRNLTNATAAGSRLSMSSGGTYNSNRIGFKGVEDLGGGMNAHFNLESGFNSGTGAGNAGLFDRTALVGLGGAWGSLDLGRQYSVNFKTIGAYDPFSYKYTAIVPVSTQGASGGVILHRLNNDIQYTGAFGGVTVRAEYALGEVAGSTSQGATQAVGVSYAGGPFNVGAAYTMGKRKAGAATVADQDYRNWTAGGAYKFGPARIAVGYADLKQDQLGSGNARTKDWWLGGSFNMTPAAALTAAYYQTKGVAPTNAALTNDNDSTRKLFIVGATYALSKRTNFYADIDNARYSNPSNQATQTGFSVGINHLF